MIKNEYRHALKGSRCNKNNMGIVLNCCRRKSMHKIDVEDKPEPREPEVICSICLNPSGKDVTVSKCNHTFHSVCIAKWQSRSDSCPICRGDTTVESKFLKDIRSILGAHPNIPNADEQFSAIARFEKGQMSYGEMRSIAG